MTQTPDDDTWLEQIRCPRYFDFEAALTVPCPNDAHTNPPLRDSVYESDDDTRTFFRALETDSSLHHTPHPQENSPPPPDLRNLRPIHRHRPTTSFQDYLQQFKHSQSQNSLSDSEIPIPQEKHPPQCTPPRLQDKPSESPRRNPTENASRTPPERITPPNADLKTPTLASIPTPKSFKKNPSPPSRLPFHTSTEVTFHKSTQFNRKSAPNEPVPLRRRRPPERVTPPLNSIASKSTSGGFGRAKTRKAIVPSDNGDGHQEIPSRAGQRAVSSENAAGSILAPTSLQKKNSEKPASEEKDNTSDQGSETNLLDVDPDILRMMEEHNRRIQQKHALNEGKVEKEKLAPDKPSGVNNRIHEQNVRRHGTNITLRNRRTLAPESEVLQWNENVGKSDRNIQQQESSLKGMLTSESAVQRSIDKQQNESGSHMEANKHIRLVQTRRKTTSSVKPIEKKLSDISNDNNRCDAPSLDDILNSENERILEERKKRLPERRRALQVDKSVALKTFEGQRSEQDRQRMLAKVEFTSANGNTLAGTSALREKKREADSANRGRGKENSTRDRPLATLSRKRGLKGFRERSKISVHSASSGPSMASSHTQKTRHGASTRRRQPYTDKIKASERQKRLEKRLEEDLQSLLSAHNSRVKGNRRPHTADEQ